jgi:hypothetical protein
MSGAILGLVGGLGMLLSVIIVHTAAVAPLLLFGGLWVLVGVLFWMTSSRTAHRVVLVGDMVTFTGPRLHRELSAAQLTGFRWQRRDPRRAGVAYFTTTDGDKIRVAARLNGLFDLLFALKQLNESFLLPA